MVTLLIVPVWLLVYIGVEGKIIQVEMVVMAKRQLGEVKTPTGSSYYYYWDDKTGEVYVGSESAGKASSPDEAWRKANYYATTCKKMR